jgi:hypothetical protein
VDRQLAAIVHGLDSARERLHALHRDTPRHAWCYRPAPDRWSPAECVAHLNLTSEALLPLVHESLREARASGAAARRRYRRDALGWIVSKLVSPSGGLRITTAPAFLPPVTPAVDRLLEDFDRLQSGVTDCVEHAEGLPIDRVTLVSPFHGRLRYSLYTALTLVPRHQHRHLLQAERAAGSARQAQGSPLPLTPGL